MPTKPSRGMRAKTNKSKSTKTKPKASPKKVKPKKDPMKKKTKVAGAMGGYRTGSKKA